MTSLLALLLAAAPAPAAKGSLDKELIRKVIHAHRADVRKCYAAETSVEFRGKLAVKFVIALSGDVSSAEVVGDASNHEALASCMASAVRTWKFPKPIGGEVEVTYPFIFASTN